MIKFQLLSGASICEFNFFDDGAIYRGAATADGLYKLIAEYSSDERSKAFALALSLEEHGQPCIISVRDGVRRVWTEIRSLDQPVPSNYIDASSPAIAAQ